MHRRQYLKTTGLIGVTGLAGCSTNQADTNSESISTEGPAQPVQESESGSTPESIVQDPVISEQLVVAHYMSGAMPHGFPGEAPTDPALYDPSGISGQIGGAQPTIPMLRLLHGTNIGAVEMAEYEMECAAQFGIDAFDFDYPYTADGRVMQKYNESIIAFFEAADRDDNDFRFTLCFSSPIGAARQEEKSRHSQLPLGR